MDKGGMHETQLKACRDGLLPFGEEPDVIEEVMHACKFC